MSASDWPDADPALERSYRRLLWAYPGSYRRRHGTEIVTTLLEMAEPGRRRPSPADAWHLIGSGLRQRFRLPAERPLAWAAAVVVTLIAGAFGAAGGSWAAAGTFTPLAGPGDFRALHESLVPAGTESFLTAYDGGTHFGPFRSSDARIAGSGALHGDAARQRLVADGWQVAASRRFTAEIMDDTGTVRLRQGYVLDAARDGLALRAQGWTSGQGGDLRLSLWQLDNGMLLPLTGAGAGAGLTAGWLVAAAGARRLRHHSGARSRVATSLTGLTVATLALPAVALHVNVTAAFTGDGGFVVAMVHRALMPGRFWPFGPEWLNAALAGSGLLLALATFALLRLIRPAGAVTATATS